MRKIQVLASLEMLSVHYESVMVYLSEQYASKQGAENGIESVRKNSPNDEQYARKDSKSGQPYFVLKAGNGEVIGQSQMYSSVGARDAGIESVQANGPNADVRDNA